MANLIKLDSKRCSGKAVREDKHEELLKVLNKMTMNKILVIILFLFSLFKQGKG